MAGEGIIQALDDNPKAETYANHGSEVIESGMTGAATNIISGINKDVGNYIGKLFDIIDIFAP